jgi:short-subunit dehydrogenase
MSVFSRSSSEPQVVVITGASSGIGRATALEFARQGARLVLASRRGAALTELVAECEALGGEAIAVPTDVAENRAVKTLAKVALRRFERIDVWLNAAGISVFGSFLDVPLDDVRRVLDVNVMGTVHGSRAALKAMTEAGQGVLINIASIVGEVQQPYTSAYGMSKAAVRALGVSLRQELSLQKQKRISVVTILPPTVDTPFFRHSANYTGREVVAMPPVYPPELVAATIVRAASSPKPEIVIGTAGKTMVREHRRHAVPIEAQMAVQTDKTQLSRKYSAEDTTGTLYDVAPLDDAAVVGGWDGAARSALRRSIAWTLVIGGGALAVTRALKSQKR